MNDSRIHGPERSSAGAGGPSRSPARGGRRGGGDELRRMQLASLGAEDSSGLSHRLANETGHPAAFPSGKSEIQLKANC